jgi:hypothetical protein
MKGGKSNGKRTIKERKRSAAKEDERRVNDGINTSNMTFARK